MIRNEKEIYDEYKVLNSNKTNQTRLYMDEFSDDIKYGSWE